MFPSSSWGLFLRMNIKRLLLAIISLLVSFSLFGQGLPQSESFLDEVSPQLPDEHKTSKTPKNDETETISIDFPEEDVRIILRNIADLYEFNLIIPDSLSGRTSVRLNEVTWDQVFKVLLHPRGYTFEKDRNIVWIKEIEESVGSGALNNDRPSRQYGKVLFLYCIAISPVVIISTSFFVRGIVKRFIQKNKKIVPAHSLLLPTSKMTFTEYSDRMRIMLENEIKRNDDRIKVMLTSQGLLFAALSFSWSKDTLAILHCSVGFLISLAALEHLMNSERAIERLFKIWSERSNVQETDSSDPPVMGAESYEARSYIYGISIPSLLCIPTGMCWGGLVVFKAIEFL